MRRMREGYQKFGYDGLRDGRSGKQCSHRVALATAAEVLRLYREVYLDLNIRHFHWKLALQGAGLVGKRRKTGDTEIRIGRNIKPKWGRTTKTL